MTIRQRVQQILLGVIMILFALIMIAFDEKSYPLIVAFYAIALEFFGWRMVWYYITMARHMVGGRSILYRGILFIDFGVFTASLVLVPHIYVLLYLSGTLAFSAVVDLLRAKEAKSIQSPWKMKALQGAIELVTAVVCLLFMHTPALVVDVCSAGFLFSALTRIINAFRRMPVVTIS